MAVSESRKKANLKWDAANLDRVSIAMPKGMKDTVKAAAAAAGESMNQYIIGATEQRILAGEMLPKPAVSAARICAKEKAPEKSGT